MIADTRIEPTVVPPVLLDLCSIAIMHRFSSPSWWIHLSNHIAADVDEHDIIDKIVRLPVSVLINHSLLVAKNSSRPAKLL